MISNHFIFPECYADTVFIEVLLRCKRVNHQHGWGKVLGQFKTQISKGNNSIALMDFDRGRTAFANLKENLIQIEDSDNLYIGSYQGGDSKVIIIKDAIESFLLNIAKRCEINPAEYGLTGELKELKSILKSKNIHTNNGYRNFLKALIKKNPAEFKAIRDACGFQDFIP